MGGLFIQKFWLYFHFLLTLRNSWYSMFLRPLSNYKYYDYIAQFDFLVFISSWEMSVLNFSVYNLHFLMGKWLCLPYLRMASACQSHDGTLLWWPEGLLYFLGSNIFSLLGAGCCVCRQQRQFCFFHVRKFNWCSNNYLEICFPPELFSTNWSWTMHKSICFLDSDQFAHLCVNPIIFN